ncbi:MAG: mucoidy inhibitor MuiA family protein [Cyanosarcina radialis HA8281-LM2]|jgi:uncharacterized protein (TIGR02231 family)|nr:mucoidy inhibitor MuiA family protein [Cyanosarcina radialis HA8281-LM2]
MNQSKTVDTKISAVTIYTDRSQIVRHSVVALQGEERELVLPGLPVSIETESVRATGKGTVAVRLLGVRIERLYTTEPVAERVALLTAEIQQLEDQKRSIIDAMRSLILQRDFVQKLAEKSVDRFSQSLARQQVGLDRTKALLDFVGQEYQELSTQIAQDEKQLQALEQQLRAKYQQLQQIQSPAPKESFSIFIAIEPTAAGDFELEVSYEVYGASWTPLYDLRVNSENNALNLIYLAEVCQNTGEDWMDVALTLSTAKPGLGTLPPKPVPWYVDIMPPPPVSLMMKRRALLAAASDDEIDAIADAAPSAMSMATVPAESVVAEVAREGSVVTFGLSRNSNIPSDGTPHKVTIFADEYPCRIEYLAIPRLVSFAYLQALVTNPVTGSTLLPGRANIYRDRTFVGTTELENVAPGQEFTLNLGIDESIKIDRDLVERQVDKKLLGGQRRTTYGYRLIITNLGDRTVNLKAIEQLPVSRNEQIKVRLIRLHPQITLGEMGMLEWSLILAPHSKQEIYYQFAIEHSPELNLVGLDI